MTKQLSLLGNYLHYILKIASIKPTI